MSTVIVIAPVLVGSWPMISAAVAAAVTSMGYTMVREGTVAEKTSTRTTNRAEIELDDSEILAETTGVSEEIVVEHDGVLARFTRDERGALKVCVEGSGYSKSQLHAIGEELIGRVTQQYVYHRLTSELDARGMAVLNEEVDADRTVRLRVRNS